MVRFALRSPAMLLVGTFSVALAGPPVTKGKQSSSVQTHQPSAPADAARHRATCETGDAAACHAAALDSYYAPTSPSTDRDALRFFQRACNAGYAPSCNGLGVLFAEGRGSARDLARAAELYRMSCDAGASTGCEHLAQALQNGHGVVRDESAAQRASTRAKCLFQATLAKRTITSCPGL